MVYRHFGNLRIPRTASRLLARAQTYLSKDPEAVKILGRLEHAPNQYTLHIIHNGNDNFDPQTRTISWDPYSALRTTSGGKQSPALGLLHEEDHAYENVTAPRKQARLQEEHLARYDNAEERRVIRGVETRAARVLGEGVRHDHRGTPYKVKDPALCRVFIA